MIRSLCRRSPVGWALLIIAAVALSVLVAWMPWRLTEPGALGRSPIVQFTVGDRLYGASWNRPWGIRRNAFIYPMGVRRDAPGDTPIATDPIPMWLPLGDIGHPDRAGVRVIYSAQANGWPFPCVYAVEGTSVAGGRTHGRALHVVLRSPVRCDRVLPYGVVWWGMLANVAIYALAILVVLEAWLAFRRRWRARRSHCPWCGYDLAGTSASVCPECGGRAYEQKGASGAR